MCFVNIEQRRVPPFDFDEPRQFGVVAIHAVQPFDRHDNTTMGAADVAQQLVDESGIVVRKRSAFRFRRERSLHDAVVGQFVIQNQVLGSEQVSQD